MTKIKGCIRVAASAADMVYPFRVSVTNLEYIETYDDHPEVEGPL